MQTIDCLKILKEGLPSSSAAQRPLLFNNVRNIRCLAWQDGRRVRWGVLFDDSRNQPVLWRQEGIAWDMQMVHRGQVLKQRGGTINSSRALNPLVEPELRELPLAEDFEGDVELQLTVGGVRTKTTLTIK